MGHGTRRVWSKYLGDRKVRLGRPDDRGFDCILID